jgi:hypothetical protein
VIAPFFGYVLLLLQVALPSAVRRNSAIFEPWSWTLEVAGLPGGAGVVPGCGAERRCHQVIWPTNFANPGKLYPHFWILETQVLLGIVSGPLRGLNSSLFEVNTDLGYIYIYINAHCHWRCQPCLIRRYTMALVYSRIHSKIQRLARRPE